MGLFLQLITCPRSAGLLQEEAKCHQAVKIWRPGPWERSFFDSRRFIFLVAGCCKVQFGGCYIFAYFYILVEIEVLVSCTNYFNKCDLWLLHFSPHHFTQFPIDDLAALRCNFWNFTWFGFYCHQFVMLVIPLISPLGESPCV